MVVRCMVPGTCGELIQGSIEGVDCLVSCPVDLYSTVGVELTPKKRGIEIEIEEGYQKTALAIERTLFYFKETNLKVRVEMESALISSKGMGKSTADLSAAIYATAHALKKKLSLTKVKEILLSIEPSDSTFIPHLALLDHREGRLLYPLKALPQIDVLIIDLGGEVDTLLFNAKEDLTLLNQMKEKSTRLALSLLIEGLVRRDLYRIGEASTISALAHQKILPKENLEGFLKEIQRVGIYGLCIAHSGTLLSILHKEEKRESLLSIIHSFYPEREAIYETKTTSGGVRYL